MPSSVLIDMISGIHCRLCFNWENPALNAVDFSFTRSHPFELVADSLVGRISLRDGWPIRVRSKFSRPVPSRIVRPEIDKLRDAVCLFAVARIAQSEPELLPYLPLLPTNLRVLSRDSEFVADEMSFINSVWRDVAKSPATCRTEPHAFDRPINRHGVRGETC